MREAVTGATSSTHQTDEDLHATKARRSSSWRTHPPDGRIHSLNLPETRPGSGTTSFSMAMTLGWGGIYLAPHPWTRTCPTGLPSFHIIPYQGQVLWVQGGFQSALILTTQIQTFVLDPNADACLLHFEKKF